MNDGLIWVGDLVITADSLRIAPDEMRSPTPFEISDIGLVRQPCHYGGQRALFLCPDSACQRRVMCLYLLDGIFRCRTCHGLPYASQGKDRFGRLLHQANKLRIALGGRPGTAYEIAPRPKGMWQTTYDRMRDQIIELESQAWGHLADTHPSLSRLR